ncbi:MAG: hypothetical protein K8F52_09020 [Candidatus Scalindua rubra]|nr:hypothetical protein [Candidatus Scalindua rubra]
MIQTKMKGKLIFSVYLFVFLPAFSFVLLTPCQLKAVDFESMPTRDTPLGVIISTANAPDSTWQDLADTLFYAKALGSHGSFIWSFGKEQNLEARVIQLWLINKVGLKSLAQLSVQSLGKPKPPQGMPPTFSEVDGVTTRAYYLECVRLFAEQKPDYINLAAEANFMYEWFRDEWNNYISLYNEAYNLVKSISPSTKVGVSYHYGLFVVKTLAEGQFVLPDELGPHDFIAFTSYPSYLLNPDAISNPFLSVDELARWYSISRLVFPDTPILFTELGWSSAGTESEAAQNLYVESLPSLMADVQPELITWAFLHDTDFFRESFLSHLSPEELELIDSLGVDMIALFKRFNGLGLRFLDGTPKSSWDIAMGLDFSPQ